MVHAEAKIEKVRRLLGTIVTGSIRQVDNITSCANIRFVQTCRTKIFYTNLSNFSIA